MAVYSTIPLSMHPTLTLSLSHEAKPHSFISHWKQNNCRPLPLASISYVNGTTTSRSEALEEALHISKCFHIPVFGIYHSQTPVPYQEVQALLEFYNHTFYVIPSTLIFQVFFGDGGDVVQAAIESLHPSLQQRVIVIGMNPTKLFEYPQARYFQTYTWFSPCSQNHNIIPLNIHPDSNPRRLNSSDPAFAQALQSISSPAVNLHYYPQKSQKWSPVRIHHATNLALTGLCLSAHTSIKIKWILQSETFRTSTDAITNSPLHQHCFTKLMPLPRTISLHTLATSSTIFRTLPQLLLPGGIFPNGTLPDGSYPYDIFPGRITPEGKFDRLHFYVRPTIKDLLPYHHWHQDKPQFIHSFPFGKFSNGSFPYLQFFSGTTSDCMTRRGQSRDLLAKRTNSPIPFSIFADGYFFEFPHEKARPYGHFHWNSTFVSSRTCRNGFPYYRFFSGELIQERHPNGVLSQNDPLYRHLPNGQLPKIYPGYILPNGSFPNHRIEYPFGVFENNSFPYADFFFGDFDYIGRYLEQLNKTNPLFSPFQTNSTSNSSVEYYGTSSTPFLHNITVTSDSIDISGFSASLAIYPLTTPIQEYYDGNQDLLATVWVIQGSALALLVTTHGSNRITKIRRVALAISSLTTYLAALDLSKQIHSAIYIHPDLFSFSAHGNLILYNIAYLAQEALRFPWLKNQCERLTIAPILRRIPSYTLSRGIQLVSNTFQNNITVIRFLSSLLKVYFLSWISVFFFTPSNTEDILQLSLLICYLGINFILIPYAITSFHEKSD